MTEAFVTLGMLFSSRRYEFEDAYLKMSSGMMYAHENETENKFKTKRGFSYSSKTDVIFSVISTEIQVEFRRRGGKCKLRIWQRDRRTDTNFSDIIKLVQAYNSTGHFSENIRQALKQRIDKSDFGDKKPNSNYCICTTPGFAYVVLKEKTRLLSNEIVLPWEIEFVNRRDNRSFETLKESRMKLKPSYNKLAVMAEKKFDDQFKSTKDIPVLHVRANMFEPTLSFSISLGSIRNSVRA
jgi:hypothetical protein